MHARMRSGSERVQTPPARLVVQDEALVGVLHQLVHREGGVVGLHHSVRHLAQV